MMVLIRFWRSLTKKDNVKSARYRMKYNIFFYFNYSFRTFFSRIWIRIFPDRIRIFGRSGSGSGSGEKNPDPKHCFNVTSQSTAGQK